MHHPTSICLREICSFDESQVTRSRVLYHSLCRAPCGQSSVEAVVRQRILACHEVTAAIVRAIDPDLQNFNTTRLVTVQQWSLK